VGPAGEGATGPTGPSGTSHGYGHATGGIALDSAGFNQVDSISNLPYGRYMFWAAGKIGDNGPVRQRHVLGEVPAQSFGGDLDRHRDRNRRLGQHVRVLGLLFGRMR
jgi:hypothetical protein